MSLNIEIKTIPHREQRYDTCGDWRIDGDNLTILVSDLGDWRLEYLVADHELREALLCRHRGISQKTVDDFDTACQCEGEPGDDPQAPYKREHFFATSIERLTAAELDVDWAEYEGKLNVLEWGA